MAGFATLVLLATSPFAISQATVAGRDALTMLWSLLVLLALLAAIEYPVRSRLAAVAAAAALVVYTDYWGLYLVGGAALWLIVLAHGDSAHRRASRLVLGALAVGGTSFVVWLPSLIHQLRHATAPSAHRAGPADIVGLLHVYTGGGAWDTTLSLCFFVLIVLGIFARPLDEHRLLFRLQLEEASRPAVWLFIGSLVMAVIAGTLLRVTFPGSEAVVVFPLFVVIAGLGASVFLDRRVLGVVLTLTSLLGMVTAAHVNGISRTQASQVAAVINRDARPGDLVLYCPDQLGPAAARLIHAPVDQITFPRATGPEQITFDNYRDVIAKTDTIPFGEDVLARTGQDRALWYVFANYPDVGHSCSALLNLFRALRPGSQQMVAPRPNPAYEYDVLVRFPADTGT